MSIAVIPAARSLSVMRLPWQLPIPTAATLR